LYLLTQQNQEIADHKTPNGIYITWIQRMTHYRAPESRINQFNCMNATGFKGLEDVFWLVLTKFNNMLDVHRGILLLLLKW